MDRKPLLFSESNLYFPYEEVLQKSIGFSSPLDIDTYIKQSFGLLTDSLMLTGADVECFTKDHLVDEHFLCYKIEGLNHKPLLPTQGNITCNLSKKNIFNGGFIQGLIQGTPIFSLIILSILTRIAPAQISNILINISMIGLLITCCYYGVKMVRGLIKTVMSQEIDYDGIGITFEKKEDQKLITKELTEKCKELNKIQKIDKLVIFEGNIFLKQSIHQKTIRQSIKDKIRRKNEVKPDINEQDRIQQTVSYLLDQNLFM